MDAWATPRVGPFSLLVAVPYSFLDVGLDFHVWFIYEFEMEPNHTCYSVIKKIDIIYFVQDGLKAHSHTHKQSS